MDSRKEAKLNMYRTVKQVCDDNSATVALNVAFLATFNSFKAKLSSLITSVTSESQVISGVAIDKSVLKKNLCQNATDIAAIVFAYASTNNNQTLKQSVNYAFSDLLKIKDDLLAPTCQNIYSAANTNLAALATYGITAAMLTTFQTAITDYSNAVPKPRTAKSNKVTYAKNINTLMKDIDLLLKEQMDKLITSFKSNKPDFYNTFKTARIIIDPNTTTTQLKGKVIDSTDKTPLKGVNIVITGLSSFTVQTTKTGSYIQKPLQPGTYTITASLDGYQTVVVNNFTAKLGQINKQDFSLVEN